MGQRLYKDSQRYKNQRLITPALLAAVNCTIQDYEAVADLGLKDCADWLLTGRAMNAPNVIDVDMALFGKHCNAFCHTSAGKWKQIETSAGVYNWTNFDATVAMAKSANADVKLNIHMLLGPNIYLPAHVISGVTSVNLKSTIETWIDVYVAHVLTLDIEVARVDLANEFFNETPTNVYSGWGVRSSGCALSAAGAARDPSDPYKFVREAVAYAKTRFKTFWPSAKICWLETKNHNVYGPRTFLSSQLPTKYSSYTRSGDVVTAVAENTYYTDDRLKDYANVHDRWLHEMYLAVLNGQAPDLGGLQLHLGAKQGQNARQLDFTMQDLNRMGIVPAVTELNADWNADVNFGVNFPLHAPSGSDAALRHGAYMASTALDVILTASPCYEISGWNADSAGKARQPMIEGTTEYPLNHIVKMKVKKALAPNLRPLKRGHRTDVRYGPRPWMLFKAGSTADIAVASGRMSIATSTPTAICIETAKFFGNHNLRPLDPTKYIVVVDDFFATANPGLDKCIVGMSDKLDGTNSGDRWYLYQKSNGTLELNWNFGGNGVVGYAPLTWPALSLNQPHRILIWFDLVAKTVGLSVDGGDPVTDDYTGSAPATIAALHILSRSDASLNYQAATMSLGCVELHHLADYPTTADKKALSTPVITAAPNYYDAA